MHISEALDMSNIYKHCVRRNRREQGRNNLSYIYLGYFVCVSVIHNCGTLCYSFSFINQTDQRDETEGLKREG